MLAPEVPPVIDERRFKCRRPQIKSGRTQPAEINDSLEDNVGGDELSADRTVDAPERSRDTTHTAEIQVAGDHHLS